MPHIDISRDSLVALLEQGLSERKVAKALGTVQSDVRYWKQKYGLGFFREDSYLCACGEKNSEKFAGGRKHVCKVCNVQKTVKRIRGYRKIVVDSKGGVCQICGYPHQVSLLCHHKDPSKKDPNWARLKNHHPKTFQEELAKVVLICQNCHLMIHFGDPGNHVRLKYEELVGVEEAQKSYKT